MNNPEDKLVQTEIENSDLDNSPANFAQAEYYVLEDDELSNSNKKSGSIKIIFNILFSPIEGWKKLRRLHIVPENFQKECFYPLLALLAVTRFIDLVYKPGITISYIIIESLFSFISYFLGYFIIILLLKAVLPLRIGGIFDKSFGKNFIIASLSTLVIFNIITNLLPMMEPVLIFLPIWTIYSVYRGIRFFKLPEKGIFKFTLILCGSIIVVPLLLEWLFIRTIPI